MGITHRYFEVTLIEDMWQCGGGTVLLFCGSSKIVEEERGGIYKDIMLANNGKRGTQGLKAPISHFYFSLFSRESTSLEFKLRVRSFGS
jgi:hypothetical protein